MDIVFSAPDYDELLAEAARLGFMSKDREGVDYIRTNGPVTGGGSFFLNYVGAVRQLTGNMTSVTGPGGGTISVPETAPLPGIWGRLRVNGSTEHVPVFSNTITQYFYKPGDLETPGFWTHDGVTPAPDYIANIGLIA